jgi:ABC-type antimicrobial peptide transport system permease subunit
VLKQVGVDPHGNDRDNELHLPYTLLMKKILKRDYLSAASFSLDESTPGNVERFMEDVRVLLRNRHGISDAADNDFTVISPTMMMGMVADVYKTFDLLVPVISLIAFFISAVVILNITLITVRERKAEIGLRKALGARVRDIKNLIIIEIVMVSVISCFIALLISKLFIMAVSPYLADYYGITAMNTSWDAVLIAILVAIVTGLVSALIPADKAAKMHPVTALS